MFSKLRHTVGRHLINIPGWRTHRKIVVIESDDWGAIRMPSKDVYEKLLQKGIMVDRCAYCKYDSLASEDDLTALFDILTKHKDIHGNYAVVTANCVVTNPDFEKIKTSGFKEYHYELFTDTLKRYTNHAKSFTLWQQGAQSAIFHPQSHGREHLNVARWMHYLSQGSKETLFAFDNQLFGLSTHVVKENRRSYMAAFDADNEQEIDDHKIIVAEGLRIFNQFFGYKSKSFIAPNYTWSTSLESTLAEGGVQYIQGAVKQTNAAFEKLQGTKHTLGEINNFNQHYIVRNCAFEPSDSHNKEHYVDKCLREISTAFMWNKPAIISAHRVNFIGSIVEDNRTQNLALLDSLLSQIVKKWPDVEFMTSDQLGDIIKTDQ